MKWIGDFLFVWPLWALGFFSIELANITCLKSPCDNKKTMFYKNVYTMNHMHYWLLLFTAVTEDNLKLNISLFSLHGTLSIAHRLFVHEKGGRNEMIWVSTNHAPWSLHLSWPPVLMEEQDWGEGRRKRTRGGGRAPRAFQGTWARRASVAYQSRSDLHVPWIQVWISALLLSSSVNQAPCLTYLSLIYL